LSAPEPCEVSDRSETGAQGTASNTQSRRAVPDVWHWPSSRTVLMTDDAQNPTSETPAPSDADRVLIFDTTLRDGEQSPGAATTLDDKLKVAKVLDEMGVDIIEAGFPISSNGDSEAVCEIAKVVKNAVVCGLSRSSFADIDRAGEAVKFAARPRIHTFISTSPVHRKWKLQMDAEQVIRAVGDSVARARQYTDN